MPIYRVDGEYWYCSTPCFDLATCRKLKDAEVEELMSIILEYKTCRKQGLSRKECRTRIFERHFPFP